MTIRAKILCGFLLAAVIVAVLGFGGVISIRRLAVLSGELNQAQAVSDDISDILSNLYGWRQGLTEAILLDSEFSGSLDPNSCALGRWLADGGGKNITDPEIRRLLEQLVVPHNAIHNQAAEAVTLEKNGRPEEAGRQLVSVVLPKTREVISLLGQMRERLAGQAEEKAALAATAASNFSGVILGGVALTVALFLVLGYVFSGWVSKKIHWHENILDSVPFPISVTDQKRRWTFVNKPVEDMFKKPRAEFYGKPCNQWGAAICNTENCGINCLQRGILTTFFTHGGLEFKVHADYLKNRKGRQIGHIEIVEDITATSAAKKSAAAYINETIVSLAEVVSDVAHKTKANSDLAARAASLSATMKGMADKGSGQMEQMIVAVKEIDESAKVINKVIKTINEIAFQTNLLALNASVEAARAGEAGRGFAVVADEVRNLATRSAKAAGETDAVIRASIEKSQLGFRIAGETEASLSEILGGLADTDRIVAEIAQSSEEQSAAIQRITQIVAEIARSSEEQSKAIQRIE